MTLSEYHGPPKDSTMPNVIDDLCYQLALANRIVAHEGVLDGFGHISVRHPDKPDHYLLSRSRSPELVEPDDILEFNLDSEVVTPGDILPYGECVIHGEIFRARPDVNAVVHHHSPAILPFCVTDVKLVPIMGLGATMGDDGAVLGQPRRIRRHADGADHERAGRLARARARSAFDGADAAPRRHRGRREPARRSCSARS